MSADRRREFEELEQEALTPADKAADRALREALLSLEVPEVSPDFDARVLSAVRGRSVWREMFLSYLRPALATASASAAITLLLIHFATRPPRPAVAAEPLSATAAQAGQERMRRALDGDTPTYAALQPLREAARRDADGPDHRKGEKDGTETDGRKVDTRPEGTD